jgi:hypothetical protein
MIDWSKVGPANGPTVNTAPTTTVPIAPTPTSNPAAPVGSPLGVPSMRPGGGTGQYEFGTGFHEASQEQIDAMDPGQRLGRGIDLLGDTLFGRGNGSPLGGIPLLGDVIGAGGNALHGAANDLVVKPIEAAATAVSHVPLGWLPGGADENFNSIGAWAEKSDRQVYEQWLLVNAAAGKDVLGGGNLKADFNMEVAKYLDDQQYSSSLGTTPELATGRETVGSLGGALTAAITGFLGLASNTAQRALGGAGIFDPATSSATYEQQKDRFLNGGGVQALGVGDEQKAIFQQLADGKITEDEARQKVEQISKGGRNRIDEAISRIDLGLEVSPIEQQAVDAYRSGEWSLDHAQDFLVSHGQGATRNFVGQLGASVLTDPLTYATIGAGAVAKAGSVGTRIVGESATASKALSAARETSSLYEKYALTVAAVQKSPMGPAFRISRGMIDPFAVYKPSTVQKAVMDIHNANNLSAMGRAYSPFAVKDVRSIGREFDKAYEVDAAIANYARDQGDLMVARKVARDMVDENLGEDLVHSNVDEVVAPIAENQSPHAETQMVDHLTSTMKNTFGPEEEATLAGRMAAFFGNDVPYWEKRLSKMEFNRRALLHAITFKTTEKQLMEALARVEAYSGTAPLRNMVLLSSDTLDDVIAKQVIEDIRSTLKGGGTAIEDASRKWNKYAMRYPKMASIGFAPGGDEQIKLMVDELEKHLKEGRITRRMLDDELANPALRPVRDVLDSNSVPGTLAEGEVGPAAPKRLWNIGFRPDEEVAWGLQRHPITGRYVPDRDPTISHVIDAVPGRQPFSDTTRNILGQIIGKSGAERLNKPVDSIEAYYNTMRDMVTGRRLVMNIEKRFERSMFDLGVPTPIAKEIMDRAKDVAGLEATTVRGLKPGNVWDAVHEVIPRDLVLKDGTHLNIHVVMDHLLRASEGDLRIMGATSVLTQRMRNGMRHAGLDPNNWTGQMTVTMYNKLRYAQPMFLIQRMTDSIYYSILYGVTPVGKSLTRASDKAMRIIEENLGRTGLGRDFSMDMPEYATKSNFTTGIKSQMQEMGLKENRLDKIVHAPDALIAANMTHMLSARIGDIVKGSLDNLAAAAAKDPEIAAEMQRAGETLNRSFEDWRAVYSANAGRLLSDDEVGLFYLQDTFNGWRRHVLNEDGTLNFDGLIHEGDRLTPTEIGSIPPLAPDIFAKELGYEDALSLRKDIMGTTKKIDGEYVHVRGEHSLGWMQEQMREKLHVSDAYAKRMTAYMSDTWGGFWERMSRPLEEGGLDISPHYAKEAQDLIAVMARDRKMDPWEYLSGVMTVNLGPTDLDTAMGRLVSFMKGGKVEPGDWGAYFRAHLDPSAQQTLVEEWGRTTGSVAGNAEVPKGFTKNPYVASSGHTFNPAIKRDGLFHVTTAKDAVTKEGFKPGAAEGFGSAGDKSLQGRVSFVTDRERAQTYMDRITIAVKAARGEAGIPEIKDAFRGVFEDMYGSAEEAEKHLQSIVDAQLGHNALTGAATTPRDLYNIVRQLDGAIIGSKVTPQKMAVILQAPFEDIAKKDLNQIAMLELATKEGGVAKKGIDAGELTLPPEELHVLGTGSMDTEKFFSEGIVDMLKARVKGGEHPNPDVEGAIQQVAKLVQATLKNTAEDGNTRRQLRELVNAAKVERNFPGGIPGAAASVQPAAATAEDVAAAAAESVGPDLAKARVDSFYDNASKNYISRLVDADGNQIGDAITDGTAADRAVSTRTLRKQIDDAIAGQAAPAAPAAPVAGPPKTWKETLDRMRAGEADMVAPNGMPLHPSDIKVVEKRAAEEAGVTAQDSSEIIIQAEQDANDLRDQIVTKWRESETKNYARMEKHLDQLEEQGFDMSEAKDHLSDYQGIERADFTADEYGSRADATDAYNEARQEKWDEVLDSIDSSEWITPDHIQQAADAADEAAIAQTPRVIPNAPYTEGKTHYETLQSIVEGMGLPKRRPDGTSISDEADLPSVAGRVEPDGSWSFPDGYPADAKMLPALDRSYGNADQLKLTADDGTPNQIATFKVKHSGNVFGVPGSEKPIDYVYRAVSEEDYQNILKTGVMKSDGRMNLSADEGTVTSHRDPSYYLPGDTRSAPAGENPGRILKIKVREGDGWHLDGRDSYIKTSEPIPVDRIEMVSPKIVKNKVVTPSKHNSAERTYPDDVDVRITRFEPDPGFGPTPAAAGGAGAPPTGSSTTLGPEDLPPEPSAADDILAGIEAMPTNNASPFNRSQALIISLLKNKITDAQADVFRLAEMQTQRTVLERSLNHPLFGLYPASYMWGKVLPETVKFLAKNPYAATYTIAAVQRSIAIQREFDRELDDKVGSVDRSAGAFLLDYLTPGLPWSDHSARMSPLVRDIFGGKDIGTMWRDELSTVSPQRWVGQVVETMNEVPGAINELQSAPGSGFDPEQGLANLTGGGVTEPVQSGQQINGPVSGSALAPLLQDDLSRLQSILISGESPEK